MDDLEDNELIDGQDQIFSPFLPEENPEKRERPRFNDEILRFF